MFSIRLFCVPRSHGPRDLCSGAWHNVGALEKEKGLFSTDGGGLPFSASL